MKTSDLIGSALDWAVAKCEDVDLQYGLTDDDRYSTDWYQGGPIIEREKISTWPDPSWYGGRNATPEWLACKNIVAEEGQYWSTLTGSDPASITGDHIQGGDTPLIAAMRCYVASKLGDIVDIPKELA